MLAIALLSSLSSLAQEKLPVIRSAKKQVTIREGKYISTRDWNLEATADPDTYYVQVPRGQRTITFLTGTDSISFAPKFGQSCDFIILYNNRDSCHIRISATYHDVYDAVRVKPEAKDADTIPFFMQGSRIYFKGSLNGKKDFNLQFDLGAGVTVINENSVKKAGLKFDATTSIANTSGVSNAPTSSKNTIQIARLQWRGIPIVQVDNMQSNEDLVIGNQFFEKKVVEIDYDKKIIVLTDSLASPPKGYSTHPLLYYQHRPRMLVNVKVGEKYYPFHFLFDTGRDGTMLIGEDFTAEYGLWEKYRSIFSIGSKKIVVIPEVKIGDRSFSDILTNANDPARPTGKQSLLGNQVLNQFNVILDNPNAVMYLRPNSNQNENYATYAQFKRQAIIYGGIALAVLAALIILFKRWRKSAERKKHRHS